MKIRFNGMITKVTHGCAPCGHKVKGSSVFVTRKNFILPSGADRTFRIGEEYEVNDLDGNFLLSYSQVDKDGVRQDSFTRIA